MIVKEVLDKTTKFFKDKKIESARLDSELLISSALGLSRIDLYLKFEQPLKEEEVELCRSYVRRRTNGEPIAYILGYRDFYGLSFKTDARVLIPRPETELLVERALNEMKESPEEKFQVLDLGCGSGCIGLSIASREKRGHVLLMDFSAGAVEVANLNRENLNLQANTEVFESDVMEYAPAGREYDFILANPPYISNDDPEVQEAVRKFEPPSALFSKNNGLADIFSWSERYTPFLKQGGFMIFEIGYLQGAAVARHFQELQFFDQIEIIKDLSGLDRFILGKKKRIA
jgi:release factor glutamine methyltransferase